MGKWRYIILAAVITSVPVVIAINLMYELSSLPFLTVYLLMMAAWSMGYLYKAACEVIERECRKL